MNRRNTAMDIYKMVFAIYVMLYHSCIMVEDRSVACARGGYLAVEFFFMVSGILMVSSAKRITEHAEKPIQIGKETFDFVIRKIKSILPYYIFAYVSSFVLLNMFKPISLSSLINTLIDSIVPTMFMENTGIGGNPVIGGTWYLSAMFIAMMVIFPLLLKNRNFFLRVFSPLVAVIGYGYMLQTYNGIAGFTWHVFSYASTLRAFTGLCLGACCYLLTDRLSKMNLCTIQRIALTLAELMFFAVSVIYMWNDIGNNLVRILFCIAGLTVVSFSGQTYISRAMIRLNTKYINQYSVCLYLCHYRIPDMIKRSMLTENYREMLPLYVVLAILISLICLLTVNGILSIRQKKTQYNKKRAMLA